MRTARLAAFFVILFVVANFYVATKNVWDEENSATRKLDGKEPEKHLSTIEDLINSPMIKIIHIKGSSPIDPGVPWSSCAWSSSCQGVPPPRPSNVIFQTVKSYSEIPDSVKDLMATWSSMNPAWHRIVLDDKAASFLVRDQFGPHVANAFNDLTIGAMRADVLRVLLIYLYGGVYADADTSCERTIDRWYRKVRGRDKSQSECSLVTGVEGSGVGYLMQWAIGPAVSRSPLLQGAVNYILERIASPGQHIDTSTWEFVLLTTGPKAWSEGLFRAMFNVSILNDEGPWEEMAFVADQYKSGKLFLSYPSLYKAMSKFGLCIMTARESNYALRNHMASIGGLGNNFTGWSSWHNRQCQLYADSTRGQKQQRNPDFHVKCRGFCQQSPDVCYG